MVNSFLRSCIGLPGGCVHPAGSDTSSKVSVGDVPDEPRQWRAFEYADMMEQGMSRGISSSFIEAPQKELRLCVQQSPDRKEFLLSTRDGEDLLIARLNDNTEAFHIFVANDGDPPRAVGPAFTLRANTTRDAWTLYTETCDECERNGRRTCGVRELASFRHHMEESGNCAKMCCMDVEIPAVMDGGALDVWCQMCKKQGVEQECVQLSSIRPKWSSRSKALMLDFYGRCDQASIRNFQLELHDKPGKFKLLFGKVGTDQYVLDYSKPLGMVQAFALAISTSVWK